MIYILINIKLNNKVKVLKLIKKKSDSQEK